VGIGVADLNGEQFVAFQFEAQVRERLGSVTSC
jgi:hypothetical protein